MPDGTEPPYQVAGLRKVEASLDRNCHRPLDAAELLELAEETIRKLYDAEAPLRPGKQPFLVSAVVIDIRRGDVDIYLQPNE